MASRYENDPEIRGGSTIASAKGVDRIRSAYRRGEISVTERILKEGERIDKIAGDTFGDGRLWWVIAALSDVGWWMQLPPGTVIRIPTDVRDVLEIV